MENTHYCNACDSIVPMFAPNIKRKNALCPMCNSLERHRFFKYWFDTVKNNFNEDTRILHFAPEKSISALLKNITKKNYISVDIIPKRAMKVEDITEPSFPDKSFDFIFCSHVLQHVRDDKKAISELYRVLDKNGMLILLGSHGNKKTEEIMRMHPEGHAYFVRLYNTKDLINKLSSEGFSVEILYPENLINDATNFIKLGIRRGEALFICKKN